MQEVRKILIFSKKSRQRDGNYLLALWIQEFNTTEYIKKS